MNWNQPNVHLEGKMNRTLLEQRVLCVCDVILECRRDNRQDKQPPPAKISQVQAAVKMWNGVSLIWAISQ